jgi:hypothetical protein
MAERLTTFISYAREGLAQLAWVTNLAALLDARADFHVVFDRYDVHAGKDLTQFMERAVTSDRIVVVATPIYVEKARSRAGGVGYESSIISADLLKDQLSARVVPVLRAGDELPDFLKSKAYVDLRNDEHFAAGFRELVAALQGLSPVPRPAKQAVASENMTSRNAAMMTLDLPGPVVIASLPEPVRDREYYGPIEFENVGERDAFNVDVADISNRSRLARFSRIARLRPGEKVALAPVIEGAEKTRNGVPDLYSFAWVGQIGDAWDLISNTPRVVPKEEIAEAVSRTFVAPIRISYIDAMNRSWITHCELIFGRDHAGRHRLAIEFRRVQPETV